MKSLHSLILGLFLGSIISPSSLQSILSKSYLGNLTALPANAQITIDGTTNTTLTNIENGIRIDGGNRAEGNLFHSFEQFSVLNGSEAFFNNANDIVNIFSRVTGGNISNIDGLLRANGTANLFLLNPAGIIFGENAQLDIGGSFLSSTADSIVFSDGVKFLATDSDEPPLLTINMPIGLNLGNNPGQIVNRSYNGNGLEVATGESITLVGGNINLEGGRLFVPEGRVELGGLSAAGKISINDDGSLVFPEGVARADVTLTNGARVDVRGAGGGSIGVHARNLELSGGELGGSNLSAGIAENSGSPDAQAGDITLNAGDNITVSQGSFIFNTVEESGVGNAGEINMTTANLSLTEGGMVDASTWGKGNGGNINITVGSLSVEDGAKVLSRNIGGEGDAGRITITAEDTVTISGLQGDLSPTVGTDVTGEGIGNGNDLNITANSVLIEDEAIVAASIIFGQGKNGKPAQAGNVNIKATGNNGEVFVSNSVIFSEVGVFSVGNGGNINIEASKVSLEQGASLGTNVRILGEGNGGDIKITTDSLTVIDGSQLFASTSGMGDAGDITIIANDTVSFDGEGSNFVRRFFLPLDENGMSPSAAFSTVEEDFSMGNGGNIDITTSNLSVINKAEISVQSSGQGSAGNIAIQTNSLALENSSSLLASTPVDTGGSINLEIAEGLTLRDNSTISAQAFEDANGGNININADFVIAFPNQNNDIIASAEEGTGGNIEITTRGIFGIEERSSNPPNNTNDIDASSEFGLDGTITINELDTNPAEGIEDLPKAVIDTDQLVLLNLCSLARDSEFYFTAKGGNTPDPVEIREEGVIAVDLVEPVPFEEFEEQGSRGAEEAGGQRSRGAEVQEGREAEEVEKEIVEAQGWIFHENGVIELVAYKTDPHGAPAQPKDPKVCPK